MTRELQNEVVRRWREGASQRAIAQALGISRGRVQRVLSEHAAAREGRSASAGRKRPSLLDAYAEVITDLLGRYPDITAVRLHEELRSRGFSGKYTIVRDRLSALRPAPVKSPVVRFETAPGAQAQMDYSTYEIEFLEEGRRKVHAFSYVLGYSRRQYLRFVERQDFPTTLQQHVRAFEHLGGVAATCLYDNMKVVVTGYDHDVPIYNTQFLAFATHYGYRPVACRPRRSQTKGKVERPFYYVEKNLLNGRTFRSLAHLNEVAVVWLAETADVRIHGETRQTPLARHAEELPYLIPLPTAHFETAEVVYRSVSAEGYVRWKQNQYSVPWRYVGQQLLLRITPDELIVYSPGLEAQVARHALYPAGTSQEKRTNPQHHAAATDPQRRVAVLRERYTELGPIAVRFLEGLIRTQRYHWDQAQRLLALLGSYSRADLLKAFERGARYGAYSTAAVERILAAEARPLLFQERQAEQEHLPDRSLGGVGRIEPRSTAEYQPLLEELPPDVPANEKDETGQGPSPATNDSRDQRHNATPTGVKPTAADLRDPARPGGAGRDEPSLPDAADECPF